MGEERQVKRILQAKKDTGKEAERKTAKQMELCAPNTPGEKWIEPRGSSRGDPRP